MDDLQFIFKNWDKLRDAEKQLLKLVGVEKIDFEVTSDTKNNETNYLLKNNYE